MLLDYIAQIMPPATGSEYKDRLRDDRTVIYKGEEIDDVTTHPATRGMIETQAELFDLQHDEEYRDILTYESEETGKRESIFYKRPTSIEELKEQRKASQVFHDQTLGHGGRANVFLARGVTGMAITHDVFDQDDDYDYGQNVLDHYEYCRDNDLAITHAVVDPQIDRSKSSSFRLESDNDGGNRPGVLRKVDETDDGIIVSGARMLATLGPQADELHIYPFGHFSEDEADQALAFAVPLDADGLRMICRPALSANDKRNHPLSSRLDEMDTFVVFDEVFVPRERVFIDGDTDLASSWIEKVGQTAYVVHDTLVKDRAKTEAALGVALLVAESTGVDQYFHVQSKLGEIVEISSQIEGCMINMEHRTEEYKDTGYMLPPMGVGAPGVASYADDYQRITQIIRDLAGSGIIGVPAWEDLEADGPVGKDVETYFRGKDMDAKERLGVQKLAFDMAVSGFGNREAHYERNHFGGPMRVKSNLYHGYPKKEEVKERVQKYGLRGADEPQADEERPKVESEASTDD